MRPNTTTKPNLLFYKQTQTLRFLGNEIHLSSCYVKCRLQPTRSFGDFYLKEKEFSYDFESKK